MSTVQIYLESERLFLRRFSDDDVENLFELDRDPEVMRFLNGGLCTPRRMIQCDILPMFLQYYETLQELGAWAANEKSTGSFLGWFSLLPVKNVEPVQVELGYRLRKSAWGKGYATEGARALIKKAFTELRVQRVSATTYEGNIASRRVLEKSGMTLVRTYRMTSADLLAQRSYRVDSADIWDGDDLEYALSKDDWERTLGF